MEGTLKHLPPVTVGCADVRPRPNQKVHDVVVTPADGIVEGGNAFVVGTARVNHLQKKRMRASLQRKYGVNCREANTAPLCGNGSPCASARVGLGTRTHLLYRFLHRLQFANQRSV